jgi:hypothetical protein
MVLSEALPCSGQRWELYGSELNSDGFSFSPVNDSDSDDNIPWYNINSARTIVRGPTAKQVVHVDMNDNFSTTVSWTEAGKPMSYLLEIVRDQTFDAWLVAHRSGSSEYTALQHVAWKIPVLVQFMFDDEGGGYHNSAVDRSETSTILQPNPWPPIPPEAFRMPRVNTALALYHYDSQQKRFVAWAWPDGRPPPV